MEDGTLLFLDSLVLLDLEAGNADDAIRALGEKLVSAGCVNSAYIDDVIQREADYPTGLPTHIPVAIPHACADNCMKTALAVGVLKQSIPFREMGTPGNILDVEMVFLLALKDSAEQTTWLRNLMGLFKDNGILTKIRQCGNATKIANLINTAFTTGDENVT